jgi:hypothetical protein
MRTLLRVLFRCPNPVYTPTPCTLSCFSAGTRARAVLVSVCPVNIILIVVLSARRKRIVCHSAARVLLASCVPAGPRPRPLLPACTSTTWLRLPGHEPPGPPRYRADSELAPRNPSRYFVGTSCQSRRPFDQVRQLSFQRTARLGRKAGVSNSFPPPRAKCK